MLGISIGSAREVGCIRRVTNNRDKEQRGEEDDTAHSKASEK